MLRTPTYHVFKMYRGHQGAQLLGTEIDAPGTAGAGESTLPQLQVSASADGQGNVTVTAVNLSLTEPCEVELHFDALRPAKAVGTVLAGEVHAHNAFDAPDAVAGQPLAVQCTGAGVRFTLPPCAVAAVHVN